MTNDLLSNFSNQLADAVATASPSVVQVQGRRRPASGLVYADGVVLTTVRALGREDGLHVRRHDGQAFDDGVPDLCPLSTFFRPYDRLFVLSNAIRAATAQVARIAVLAMVDLPSLWPETMTGPPRGAGEI